jgi:hypothetical protein
MDAEPILLPKICDVRSHFRVSIGDAILFVDRLKRDGRSVAGIRVGVTKGTVALPLRAATQFLFSGATCQHLSPGLIWET